MLRSIQKVAFTSLMSFIRAKLEIHGWLEAVAK